jgi:hypothetical protein
MSVRRAVATLACATALLAPASAPAAYSVGAHEQIAWVRRAATRFVTAELTRNGAEACAVLNAPLRATRHGVTCEQRWKAKLAKLLRQPGERAHLRSQQREISSAAVIVHGNLATLELPTKLLGGPNHFLWNENCWMLEG